MHIRKKNNLTVGRVQGLTQTRRWSLLYYWAKEFRPRAEIAGDRELRAKRCSGLRARKVVVLDGEARLAWASGTGDALSPGDIYIYLKCPSNILQPKTNANKKNPQRQLNEWCWKHTRVWKIKSPQRASQRELGCNWYKQEMEQCRANTGEHLVTWA